MRKVDSRVGLSIDSGSASCASDLSDSEGSWAEEACAEELPRSASLDEVSRSGDNGLGFDPLLHSSVVLNPDGGSWSHLTADVGVVRDLPRTPSFRSRIHRQQEEDEMKETTSHTGRRRERRDTATSWDDDVRIARHPRAPSLRLCLTLCTLTLVLMSMTSTTSTSSRAGNDLERSGIRGLDIRREQVVLPFHSHPDGSHQSRRKNPLNAQGLRSEPLPKYYLPDEDQLPLGTATGNAFQPKETSHDTSQSNRKVAVTRSNLAMARPVERRPVFGAAAGPQVERFVLDSDPPSKTAGPTEEALNPTLGSNWTSWLAAVALIAMLVETGYKEYRQCRMDDFFEEQRRL
jgi:hypothetical protein